jgi:peroxiredoxin
MMVAFIVTVYSAPVDTILKPGVKAPGFSMLTLDGSRVALNELCGDTLLNPYSNKVRNTVILSFWATYCQPCQKEIPELQKFMANHANDAIKLFCVSIDKEGKDIVDPFVKKYHYTVPVLLDRYKVTAGRYGVKHLPALFVIDAHGVIRYSSTGYDDKMKLQDKLEGQIRSLKGPVAVKTKTGGPVTKTLR